jgi:hypothetical protein
LYPSKNSTECDRYVIFNTIEKVWYYGTLDRTLIIGDSDVIGGPYAISPDGYYYSHEVGTDDDAVGMKTRLTSGSVEIDAGGNQMAHVSKLIPDFQTLTGQVDVTISAKKYPQASEVQSSGPHTMTSATRYINPRVRGRQISLEVQSSSVGDDWRMGQLRVDFIPHGGR